MQDISSYLSISQEVQLALQAGQAIVALESTVIAHGLPYPANIEIAHAMEAAVRAEGAIPATIGIHDGKIVIGLNADEIEHLATASNVRKVSRRDVAFTLATGEWGATTVAGTMLCAHLAGIRFFATGGIGGVHHGADKSMDISADLQELSQTPVLVTCAGAKSLLDLNLTLEYLETHGVPVIGWQTDEFPAFYVQKSGLGLSQRLDDVSTLARLAHIQWTSSLNGILVTCPIPTAHAMEAAPIEQAITKALQQAQKQGIQGSALTPYVLSQVAQATTGESIEANKALLLNNAHWAARFAQAYHNL
ncbi:pseudouridine-5'-phosphate glycosidase [Dictyobacter kobayashii]|uniref:Pseudouridine-5'-phosphate glycosidase n=1 Tax=Dictyobacter kobayashii TaxID=2014872 RepID=A0A402AGR9_9CHLR|nr:pseudouridine-5'-phosphate glycosidase [Dictyobacter kobayashii]GCE18275.1 pseudouridine-5'-phosphate glycosidase [Dictyobacter kobayashii]